MFFLGQLQLCPHDLRHHFTDGRAAGETGRFDAGAVNEVLCTPDFTDDEFMAVLVGAQTREGGDNIFIRNLLYVAAGVFQHLSEAVCSGVRGLRIRHINGSRA